MFLNLFVGEPKLIAPPCAGIIFDVSSCKTVWSISLLPPTPISKSISSPSSEPDASVAPSNILLPSVSSNNCPALTVDVELFNSYLPVVELYVRTSPSS